MSFRVLPGSVFAGPSDCRLGFRVISKGNDGLLLRMALSGALLRAMGWNRPRQQLQLLVGEGEDAGRAQLIAVEGGGRKIAITGADGRGEALMRYTTDEEQFFAQYDGLCELTISEEDEVNGVVTFELPVMPEAEKKGGEK